MKFGRRECEVCEKRVSNVRTTDEGTVGECPEHGTMPAWITGCRQNWLDNKAMEEAMRYDPSTMRDEDGPWGGGFARNH